MFHKFLYLLSLTTLALAAYEDEKKYYRTPPPPRILSHKQSQLHDGGFKFAFAAENGLAQTEVIAPDGTRNGGYTYVDPHGKQITVKYSAGKDGFRILEGEHIPREVAAHPADISAQQSNNEHDDGSYKPERDEHPYDDQSPNYKPQQQQAFHAHVYQPAPQPPPRPHYQQAQQLQPQLLYKTSYAQPQYVNLKPYIPQKPLAQPRSYAPIAENENYSNSVETEIRGPIYKQGPGPAHSYGPGYAFSFSN